MVDERKPDDSELILMSPTPQRSRAGLQPLGLEEEAKNSFEGKMVNADDSESHNLKELSFSKDIDKTLLLPSSSFDFYEESNNSSSNNNAGNNNSNSNNIVEGSENTVAASAYGHNISEDNINDDIYTANNGSFPQTPPYAAQQEQDQTLRPHDQQDQQHQYQQMHQYQHHPQEKNEKSPLKIRWQRAELIGSGAFGRVYLGLDLDSGQLMAVKVGETMRG